MWYGSYMTSRARLNMPWRAAYALAKRQNPIPGQASKHKRRKWHGMRSEMRWTGKHKDNQKVANRKTRRRPIPED